MVASSLALLVVVQGVRARRTVRSRQRLSEAVVEYQAGIVLAMDARGRLSLINRAGRAWLAALGVDPAAALGQPLGPILLTHLGKDILESHPPLAAALGVAGVKAEGKPKVEATMETELGGRSLVWRTGMIDGGGVVVVGLDMTEERRRTHLVAAGRLAAGAAHEIRNPITAIKGLVELSPSEFQDILLREIDRIERIVDDMLYVTRPSRVPDAVCNLTPLLHEIVTLFGPRAAQGGVDLGLGIAPNLPLVRGEPDRLKQVFLNLLGNALEAVPPGGHVAVSVTPMGAAVEVRVIDDGPGVPPDARDRIFESFYTTKAGGTGLGLAVTDSIVRDVGGSVRCESGPDGGATFVVALPIAAREP